MAGDPAYPHLLWNTLSTLLANPSLQSATPDPRIPILDDSPKPLPHDASRIRLSCLTALANVSVRDQESVASMACVGQNGIGAILTVINPRRDTPSTPIIGDSEQEIAEVIQNPTGYLDTIWSLPKRKPVPFKDREKHAKFISYVAGASIEKLAIRMRRLRDSPALLALQQFSTSRFLLSIVPLNKLPLTDTDVRFITLAAKLKSVSEACPRLVRLQAGQSYSDNYAVELATALHKALTRVAIAFAGTKDDGDEPVPCFSRTAFTKLSTQEAKTEFFSQRDTIITIARVVADFVTNSRLLPVLLEMISSRGPLPLVDAKAQTTSSNDEEDEDDEDEDDQDFSSLSRPARMLNEIRVPFLHFSGASQLLAAAKNGLLNGLVITPDEAETPPPNTEMLPWPTLVKTIYKDDEARAAEIIDRLNTRVWSARRDGTGTEVVVLFKDVSAQSSTFFTGTEHAQAIMAAKVVAGAESYTNLSPEIGTSKTSCPVCHVLLKLCAGKEAGNFLITGVHKMLTACALPASLSNEIIEKMIATFLPLLESRLDRLPPAGHTKEKSSDSDPRIYGLREMDLELYATFSALKS